MTDTTTNDLLALLAAAFYGADTDEIRSAIGARLEGLDVSSEVAGLLNDAAEQGDRIREALETIAGLGSK